MATCVYKSLWVSFKTSFKTYLRSRLMFVQDVVASDRDTSERADAVKFLINDVYPTNYTIKYLIQQKSKRAFSLFDV